MWVLNFSVMAKQRFGINDAYRGTVGTVIGYEWRGKWWKWCLRSRPLRVRNPRTAKQQSNRMLFKQAVDLASHVRMALKKGLRGVSLGMHMTECNLFVKRNKECFSLDAEGQMVVDWERLVFSEGEVAAPVFVGVETRPAASLQMGFEWDGGSGDDEVYVYAYCPELEEGVLSAPAWRRMKSVQLALPERWQGKEVHFYGFAVDNEGNASATTYIGALQPEEVLSGWHNICRDDYVINEKNTQSWQTRKNNKTISSSTFTPTWPREPIVTLSWSATTPPR